MTNATPRAAALRPCPFCGCAMQFRGALWPSEGDSDGIIHAVATDCPLSGFGDGTANGSIVERWNNQAGALAMEKALLTAQNIVELIWLNTRNREGRRGYREALTEIEEALAQWGAASEGQGEEKV